MTEPPPQLWVIAGPNGAGKTTLTTGWIAGQIPIVNPDEIAQRLPRIGGRLDERSAGVAALRERAQRLNDRDTFAIETTLSGHSPTSLIRTASALGYKVTLMFMGLADASLSIMRVADRVLAGGHDVPIDAIVRRYDDSLARLTLVWGLVDRAYLIDNSGPRRRLILSKDADGIRQASCSAPLWARIALPLVSWDLEGS